jgi:hypothetical protein
LVRRPVLVFRHLHCLSPLAIIGYTLL